MIQRWYIDQQELETWDRYALGTTRQTGYVRRPEPIKFTLGEKLEGREYYDRNFILANNSVGSYNIIVDVYFSLHWINNNCGFSIPADWYPVNANYTYQCMQESGFVIPTSYKGSSTYGYPLWPPTDRAWPLYERFRRGYTDAVKPSGVPPAGYNGIRTPGLTNNGGTNVFAASNVDENTGVGLTFGYSRGVMSISGNILGAFPAGSAETKWFIPAVNWPFTMCRDGGIAVFWIEEA